MHAVLTQQTVRKHVVVNRVNETGIKAAYICTCMAKYGTEWMTYGQSVNGHSITQPRRYLVYSAASPWAAFVQSAASAAAGARSKRTVPTGQLTDQSCNYQNLLPDLTGMCSTLHRLRGSIFYITEQNDAKQNLIFQSSYNHICTNSMPPRTYKTHIA